MKFLFFALMPLLPLLLQKTPSFEWEEGKAGEHDLSDELMDSFRKEVDAFSDIYAWALVKDGLIIEEQYREGYDSSTRFPIHSCSKSITGSLVGIAIEQGLLEGLEQKVEDALPSSKGKAFLKGGEGFPPLTLRHLLTNTSGVNMSDGNWAEWRGSENWLEWIYSRKQVAKPGTLFNYATQNTHLLSAILERASGMSLKEYAEKNLFSKIGIRDALLGTDGQGIGDGGNGFCLTVRDMLRFGKLYLDGGVWMGEQVLPSSWVEEAGSVLVERHGQGTADYGLQFWVRNFEGERVYFAWGWAGQFIFVIPSANAVLVFTGNHTGTLRPYFNIVSSVVRAQKK